MLVQAYFEDGKFAFIQLQNSNNTAFINKNSIVTDRTKLAKKLEKAKEKDANAVGIVDFGIGLITLLGPESKDSSIGKYKQIVWSSRSYSEGTYQKYK